MVPQPFSERVTLLCVSRRRGTAPATGKPDGGRALDCVMCHRVVALGMALLLIAMPVAAGSQPSVNGFPFHSPSPAGYNVILLQPSHKEISILGLIECPEFEGAQRVSEGIKAFLISPEGLPLKHYPRELAFRVTATLRKTLLDGPSASVATKYDPGEFLLKLRFKLKVYHGLERRDLFPQSVKMIGMPGDVPYDERVFRVKFDIGDVPISDRVMLEILSPENEKLTHFTFGLL
jgi:hypothetical protein